MLNALTIDVEEWFHVCGVPSLDAAHWDALPSRVESTTTLLLDDLAAAGVTATWFTLGWVAQRHPALVERIVADGHQLASHGFSHTRVYELDEPGFARDLQAGVDALAAAGGPAVTAFRAPEWSINDRSLWALDVLARHGIRTDASMAPLKMVGSPSYPRRPHVRTTAAGSIVEAPPLVADRFGQVVPLGWGWGLRMSSPRRVLRAIEHTNREGAPAVLAIHPWELDPDPPRVPLPAGLRFAHYFRLDGFRARLREIVRGAAFGPLDRAVAHVARAA
ncbi:MAG TPA: polysaccharide deacetylase family protein [Vicinamibacterales bacterium]|nr:polysaccharide deacetylase family protein [Vicinamibacterales bacterium]